ncbi:helix-turn-helix domain-containing protein [Actinoplanes sp. M2I2]|uniref:helix-turn-helix domain-containing protein n=1 Tax=Actinoplanes sp. M2I2 TaxID=1734444 RepID=UPI002020F6CF|nr:helix-turn-helix domain-containing protein [Actinoplanes sp. M2I2]
MAQPDKEPCWTVADVAAYLRVPEETLYAWRKRHYGPPASRVGRYLRYEPAVVQAWFRERQAS